MSVLEVISLSGGYSEVNILNGVTVSVGTGEIVTVAGTNGAGKSTLAKAVVGLLPRVEGEIRFEGTVINAVPTEMRANRGIGYVPQVANIFPSLTVQENLEVVVGVTDQRQRIAELFAVFPALASRRRTRAGSMSGGERQQLAYARALMTRPRLIVLDETHCRAVARARGGNLRAHPRAAGDRRERSPYRAAREAGFGHLASRHHSRWRACGAGRPCRRASRR